MKKILFALALAALGATESIGQNKPQEINFAETFRDSTLRIDYIFSGNATTQRISLDKLNMSLHSSRSGSRTTKLRHPTRHLRTCSLSLCPKRRLT